MHSLIVWSKYWSSDPTKTWIWKQSMQTSGQTTSPCERGWELYEQTRWSATETSSIYSYQWFPDKPGTDAQGEKKPYKPKKEFAYRMCAGPPTSAQPKPTFVCAPAFSRSVWWWCVGGGWLCFRGVSVVVIWCAVMWCGMMSCGWLRGEMRWGDVVGCEMSCHVMSCHMMWCDVDNEMGCSVVVRCGWFWGHVMWCDVVVWCGELGDEVLWATESPCHDKAPQTPIPMRGATPPCKALNTIRKTTESQCHTTTTPYYKVLLRTTKHYSARQSTTPY